MNIRQLGKSITELSADEGIALILESRERRKLWKPRVKEGSQCSKVSAEDKLVKFMQTKRVQQLGDEFVKQMIREMLT